MFLIVVRQGLRPDEAYGIYEHNRDAIKRLAGIILNFYAINYCQNKLEEKFDIILNAKYFFQDNVILS